MLLSFAQANSRATVPLSWEHQKDYSWTEDRITPSYLNVKVI
jgi:hypothetical protein